METQLGKKTFKIVICFNILSQTQIKLPESKNENATNYNFQKILLALKAGRRMLNV